MMGSDITVRPFGATDIPQALHLSDAAGWNQVAADWLRIIDVQPEGCVGAWINDRLVGTTTFVTYGERLAWIGMVLVHPEHRREGIGRHLFQEVMDMLDRRGIEDIGLDATEYGRPLYQSEGFVDVEPIVRWQGVLRPSGSADGSDRPATEADSIRLATEADSIRLATEADLSAIAAVDGRIAGVDRRPLLEHLLREEAVRFLVSGHLDAYAVLRPGRLAWQIGPLVAPSRQQADALMGAAASLSKDREIVIDSPWQDAAALLEPWGMSPRRRLMRMTYRRVCRLLTDERMPAATSFAWG